MKGYSRADKKKTSMRQAIKSLFFKPLQLIYYSLYFWQPAKQFEASTGIFSYHKNNTDAFLLKGAVIYFCLELIAIHFIAMKLAPDVLWPAFTAGILTILYFLGMLVAWRLWPVTWDGEQLTLRTGLSNTHNIDLRDIESIQATAAGIDVLEDATILKLTILAQPNVLIRVKPGVLPRQGLIRERGSYEGIAFYLDEPETFRKVVA